MVPNPDGKTYDRLQIYFKRYGGPNTIAIMDLGAGTVRSTNTGKEYWNFHLAPHVVAPNGKLYLSVLDGETRQQVCVYDPGTDHLRLGAVAMPSEMLGESHPMVLGPDKKIYCAGTHPSMSVTAVQIDPATESVTFYGPIGPTHSPAPCWAYSMGVDDHYIYIASGKTPCYLVAFNRHTRKSEVLITHDKADGYMGVQQESGGASCFVRSRNNDGSHTDVSYWLYGGKAIPGVEPKPWPVPHPEPADPPLPQISRMSAAPDINGQAVLWYRWPEDKAASAVASAVSEDNVREEEEIAALPSHESMRAAGCRDLRYNVEMYSMRIDRLIELPDGRVMGTAGHYLGNFFYDPQTGKREHPGRCGLSHYSTLIHEGKVYMSGYPNGPLYLLDPSLPWTANKPINALEWMRENDSRGNPRLLTNFRAAGAKKMLASAAGNGKVFFGGGMDARGQLGWVGVVGHRQAQRIWHVGTFPDQPDTVHGGGRRRSGAGDFNATGRKPVAQAGKTGAGMSVFLRYYHR